MQCARWSHIMSHQILVPPFEFIWGWLASRLSCDGRCPSSVKRSEMVIYRSYPYMRCTHHYYCIFLIHLETMHQTSVAHMQCDAWAYLTIVSSLGVIFLDPIGFFCIFFPSDPAATAEGCASSKLISFTRGVLGDGGIMTTGSPWLDMSALHHGHVVASLSCHHCIVALYSGISYYRSLYQQMLKFKWQKEVNLPQQFITYHLHSRNSHLDYDMYHLDADLQLTIILGSELTGLHQRASNP